MLLVHGGLWEDEVDAEFFWHRPGITALLREREIEVVAPNRPRRAESWHAEADWLADRMDGPAVVVAGSNGCSAAVRLAVARPELVERLVLAWPATAHDPDVDAYTRDWLAEFGASTETIDTVLGGETLRGVADAELRELDMPVAVVPASPENRTHQRQTMIDVRDLTGAGAVQLPGCPEPPQPAFQPGGFVDSIVQFGLSR